MAWASFLSPDWDFFGVTMNRGHALLALLCVGSTFANAELLYTIHEGRNALMTVDTANGNINFVGALGVNFDFGDLAYDSSSGTMYMIDGWGSGFGQPANLYTVDLNTGAASLVGNTGINDLFSIAYDPTTGNLYGGASTSSFNFVNINKATGAGTSIGNPGVGLDGMTYDGSTGNMLGMYAGPGSFHYIDRATGASSLANPGSGFINNGGIAYSGGIVYTIDWSGQFLAYDVTNGYNMSVIANLGDSYDGLAAVPEPATMVALGAGLLALARRRKK